MRQRKQILIIVTALGLGLGLGWVLPAQQTPPAKAKAVKDQGEYDIYNEYAKAKDAKSKLDILEKWKKGYPDSDFAADREEEYLPIYRQSKDNRKAFDKAKELRGKNPNHFYATTTILELIYQMGNPPSAPDLATAEEVCTYLEKNLDTFFAASNKPPTVPDPQWANLKPQIKALAMKTYAWIWVQRKDDVRSETEVTKVLQSDGTLAQFSQYLATAQFNQRQKDPNKQITALFHYARAANYTGANELPAAARTQLNTFVKNAYTQYHGSDQGLAELIALAKANVFPPVDFAIKSKNELLGDEIAKDEEWKKANPELAIWRDTVRGPLLADDGAKYFEDTIKGSLIPGGLNGVNLFKAKIVSMDPPTNPKKLVVAVFDAAVPDATLEFEEALPGDMAAGAEIQFAGEGKSFTKDPFNVTFDIVEKEHFVGWTGVAAAKGKAKGGAPKGKAKGGTKAK